MGNRTWCNCSRHTTDRGHRVAATWWWCAAWLSGSCSAIFGGAWRAAWPWVTSRWFLTLVWRLLGDAQRGWVTLRFRALRLLRLNRLTHMETGTIYRTAQTYRPQLKTVISVIDQAGGPYIHIYIIFVMHIKKAQVYLCFHVTDYLSIYRLTL